MASNPSIRASDQDRDRVASLLREHHAVGRLDPDEFAERLDRAMTARTIGELDELTADLPAIDLYPLPTASLPRNRRVNTSLPAASALGQAGIGGTGQGNLRIWRGSLRVSPGWVAAWGSWSTVMLVCLVLWAVGGSAWPLLWASAIGAGMGLRLVAGHHPFGGGGGIGGGGASGGQIGGANPGMNPGVDPGQIEDAGDGD